MCFTCNINVKFFCLVENDLITYCNDMHLEEVNADQPGLTDIHSWPVSMNLDCGCDVKVFKCLNLTSGLTVKT